MEGLSKILLHLFIYSLVISTLLGGIAYFFMFISKKLTSIIRYNILVTFLSLFVISMLYMVCVIISNVYFEANNEQFINLKALDLATYIGKYQTQISTTESNLWSFFLESYYKIYNYAFEIILLWYGVFCYKSVRLYLGLRSIKKIVLESKKEMAVFWNEKVTVFSKKIGLDKKIEIYTSSSIKSPMVLGFFKPVILLPVELITGMPLAQLEAIIYHELTHIKRYDPIVNLLQNILETIFFFNPPLLWLLNQIRSEREKCCDDLVLGVTNNKKDYVKALYFCADLEVNNNDLMLAFASNNEELLDRVKRIVFNKESFYSRTQTAFFYMLSTILLLISLAFTGTSKLNKQILEKDKLESVEKTSIEGTSIFTGITSESLSEEEGKKIVGTLKVIINKMSNEGLINNKKDLSFTLDKDKLIVNNKKVSSDIHNKYKTKFIKKDDWRICYNYRIKF